MSEQREKFIPAFPVTLDHRGCVGAYGMTLRDWFAAQALQGYLAGRNNSPHETPISYEASRVACDCYAYADAMFLARLTKPE